MDKNKSIDAPSSSCVRAAGRGTVFTDEKLFTVELAHNRQNGSGPNLCTQGKKRESMVQGQFFGLQHVCGMATALFRFGSDGLQRGPL